MLDGAGVFIERLHSFGGFCGDFRAVVYRFDRAFDKPRCIADCLCGLARKHSYLVGNNRKAPARFARARSLDCRIERENIRLKRNILDCVNDIADFVGGFVDVLHRVGEAFHLAVYLLDKRGGLVHKLTRADTVALVFLYLLFDIAEVIRKLVYRSALYNCTLRKRVRNGRNLLGAGAHLTRSVADIRHNGAKLILDNFKALGKPREISRVIPLVALYVNSKVLVCKLVKYPCDVIGSVSKRRAHINNSRSNCAYFIRAVHKVLYRIRSVKLNMLKAYNCIFNALQRLNNIPDYQINANCEDNHTQSAYDDKLNSHH